MIFITGGVFVFGIIIFLGMGIGAKGPWKYRSVRGIVQLIKKKGIRLPEWITNEIILKTWFGMIIASFIASLFIIIAFVSKEEVYKIAKPEYGQGVIQEELEIEWIDENGESDSEKIQFQVEERKLTEEEISIYMAQVKEKIPEIILGDNENLESIDQSLNLVNSIEGIPVDISWLSSNTEVINYDGSLGMDIPQAGIKVCLTAIIQIQNVEDVYMQYITVYPQKLDMIHQIQYWLENQSLNTEKWIMLPKHWETMELSWKRISKNRELSIVVLLLMGPVFYVMKCRQDYKENKKNRQEQLVLDYPRILNKLTLLLSAGLNTRNAIKRIGNDYKKNNGKVVQRAAYEEILILMKEMERGISEKQAYERFGERCEILPYRTLAALLIQHLQKGGDNIQHILEEECKKAQESRIAQVKIMGEKVSTKLLFPMILMLIIVFVLILVPAWCSFSI